MRASTRWTSLALAVALGLLPAATAAQSDDAGPTPGPVTVPELDGLAWYRAIDTTGTELATEADDAEAEAWDLLAQRADGSLEALEYTFQEAFDPGALPDLGAVATVRLSGAESGPLQAAVVQDIVDQVVQGGGPAPEPVEDTIGGREVTVVPLSGSLGYYEEAIVYAAGDTAWVLLLPRELAEQALQRLP